MWKKCVSVLLAVCLSLVVVPVYAIDDDADMTAYLNDLSLEELKALRSEIDSRIAAISGGETDIDDDGFEDITLDDKAGTLVIKGFSFQPKGFKGYSNTDKYNGYSIFTVHATITLKGEKQTSSWMSFCTQAYQNGIDCDRHTDFSKRVGITTNLMPGTAVDIDYDFLVESPTAPVTFVVKTWGKAKTLFQQEFEINGTVVTPKK